MGSLYRSEPVSLHQLFVQSEASFSCLSELGELGLVQFKDLNASVNAFQRTYVNEVRRCEEMERKIRFLSSEMEKSLVKIADKNEIAETPSPTQIIEMETSFEKLENEIKEVNSNLETLKRNFLDLMELKNVLHHSEAFFEEHTTSEHFLSDPNAQQETGHLQFVAGVILRERFASFERLLWRVGRGNVLVRNADIEDDMEDPLTREIVHKVVFLIFYQGDALKARVKKVCDGFRATLYTVPETLSERKEMESGVMARIEDLNFVLRQTEDHRRESLASAADDIRPWMMKVRKLKAVYHALNMLNIDVTDKYLIGECWVPDTQEDRVKMALQRGSEKSGCGLSAAILNRLETFETPPTYNRTNKFTKVFQSIVNSYGIASYMEVNPAPFTIISFPFLFSLMFGDAGHGALVLLLALWMVIFENSLGRKRSTNEIWNIFFGGRYIILLMGLFSIYSGFIYNDFFSKSVNIFGSAWYANESRYDSDALKLEKEVTLDPTRNLDYRGHPFPFGMDPVWQLSENKITWLNSFKMKVSIIFGVSQMLFGVILSLQNHRYFKDPVNIFCEFIPEMIFLICIFGYLIVLILYKWIAFDATQAACAPSLLIDLINMFLINYPDEPCGSKVFYPNQKSFQTFLLLMAVLCIPWLLLPKPLILRRIHNNKAKSKGDRDRLIEHLEDGNGGGTDQEKMRDTESTSRRQEAINAKEREAIEIDITNEPSTSSVVALEPGVGSGGTAASHGHGGEFEFGEIFVHQCIHTIEYCLGCVSHTASYLRLWALSLAHSELSEVLWTMVLRQGFTLLKSGYAGCVSIFIIFTPWACLTVAILLLMEGLSAFLHTLRLHWVEFQSKFYKGEGYAFEPFSFRKVLRESDD